jgi:hypothetical protein
MIAHIIRIAIFVTLSLIFKRFCGGPGGSFFKKSVNKKVSPMSKRKNAENLLRQRQSGDAMSIASTRLDIFLL